MPSLMGLILVKICSYFVQVFYKNAFNGSLAGQGFEFYSGMVLFQNPADSQMKTSMENICTKGQKEGPCPPYTKLVPPLLSLLAWDNNQWPRSKCIAWLVASLKGKYFSVS